MSYYQQRSKKRFTLGEDGNALVLLIAIQLTAFVLFAFIKIVYYFSEGAPGVLTYQRDVLSWVTLPAYLPTFFTRPWTLITHFFIHDGVWHLIANMLWLWAFGYILQDLSGNRKIVPIFIYGALAGALVYMLAYNIIPPLKQQLQASTALGASAGVMAIAIATTVMAPAYRIFPMLNGGIPLWVVTMIFVIIDLATIPYSNPGGHIAHLAGAGMGFLLMVQMQKGRDWTVPITNFFDWANNLFNPDKPKKGTSKKSQLYYKAKVAPFRKTASALTQQRVDEILEKIHQNGYNSLSSEEKDLLKRASSEEL